MMKVKTNNLQKNYTVSADETVTLFLKVLSSLTFVAFLEGIVMNIVVGGSHTEANAVLDILEVVVVYFRVERLHDGDASVLHVVNVVAYTTLQE